MAKKVEATIQKELVKWLRKNYPDVVICYNRLENKKNMVEIIDDKRMGAVIKGTPDLTLMLDEKNITYIFYLELKTLKGKLQQSQKEWWDNFKPTLNKKGEIAYGLQEAQKKIKQWLDFVKD